jgi:hypothetical protein
MINKIIYVLLLYMVVSINPVIAQKKVSYELNAGLLFPVGNFADIQSNGMEFSFIEHITSDRSLFHLIAGINYTHLPGKIESRSFGQDYSRISIHWKDVEFIKLFIGHQFTLLQNKGFYITPAISCSFLRNESQWFRSGLDVGTGYFLPIRNKNIKIDVGTRFGFLNLLGKVKNENGRQEKNHNVISVNLGFYF